MIEDLSIAEKGTVGKRVVANTGLMVGAKASSAVIGLVSLVIATRTLPIADVGVLLFLHAYMLLFAEVATFQSWQAMIKYGTPDIEAKDANSLMRLLRFCIALDFVGAVAAFILALIGLYSLGSLLPLLPAFSDPGRSADVETLVGYGIPYCLLILVHQGGASTGLFRLFDKFKPLAWQVLVMPTFRLVGVIFAALSGGGLPAFILAWFVGSLAGYVSLPFLAFLELKARNLLPRLFSGWPTLQTNREGMWPFVWKANIDASLATGTTHLPVLLVLPIFGTAYVSAYKVADDIAKLLSEGMLLLDRVIYPEFARMMNRGNGADIWRLVIKTGSIVLAGGLALSALPALLGPYVIPFVFGPGYEDAIILAILLVISAAVMGMAAPIYPVFYAAGRPGGAIFARLTGLIIYVVSIFLFSSLIGKSGPGWAAIVGNVTAVLVGVYLAKKTLAEHARKETA